MLAKTTGVKNNKTNKAQVNRFFSPASHPTIDTLWNKKSRWGEGGGGGI